MQSTKHLAKHFSLLNALPTQTHRKYALILHTTFYKKRIPTDRCCCYPEITQILDKGARFDTDSARVFPWQSSRPTSPHSVCLQSSSSRNFISYTRAYRRIQTQEQMSETILELLCELCKRTHNSTSETPSKKMLSWTAGLTDWLISWSRIHYSEATG